MIRWLRQTLCRHDTLEFPRYRAIPIQGYASCARCEKVWRLR